MSYDRRLGAAVMIFTTSAPGVVWAVVGVMMSKLLVAFVLYYTRTNAHRPSPLPRNLPGSRSLSRSILGPMFSSTLKVRRCGLATITLITCFLGRIRSSACCMHGVVWSGGGGRSGRRGPRYVAYTHTHTQTHITNPRPRTLSLGAMEVSMS